MELQPHTTESVSTNWQSYFDFAELLQAENIPGLNHPSECQSRFQQWFPPNESSSTASQPTPSAFRSIQQSSDSAAERYQTLEQSLTSGSSSSPYPPSPYCPTGEDMPFTQPYSLFSTNEEYTEPSHSQQLEQEMIDLITLQRLLNLAADDTPSKVKQTTVHDPVVVNLLQENRLNFEGSGDEGSLESSLLHNLSLPPQDVVNQELVFQPLSPTAYPPRHIDQPHLTLPGYPISTSCCDVPRQHIVGGLPNTSLTRIPPPSLTLQPPTSPPCVQSYDDDFQPPSSPSDILSHYGFSSALSSPGLGSHFSHSPSSFSPQPQPTLQPPGSPQIPPSCYKRHLSWPTSPSQQLVSKFDFFTPPLRSPVVPHRTMLPTSFSLSPRAVSPVPAAVNPPPTAGETHRRSSAAASSLLSPASPRHMLTVPMASSPCRSPSFFGPSLQPYQQSRSRSPSPIISKNPESSDVFLLSQPGCLREVFASQPSVGLTAPLPRYRSSAAAADSYAGQASPVLSPASHGTSSPSPNASSPVPPVVRVPSPQELSQLAQSILQSALIKKQLEEQKERFARRQQERMRSPNPSEISRAAGSHFDHTKSPNASD